MTNPDAPAYPEDDGVTRFTGMTKREYFAAAALAVNVPIDADSYEVAKWAIQTADYLIKKLNEGT